MFCKGNCRVYHRLLVARLVITQLWILLQGLADPCHVAMAENAKATGKEGLAYPITFYKLRGQKANNGLRHGQAHSLAFIAWIAWVAHDALVYLAGSGRTGTAILPRKCLALDAQRIAVIPTHRGY